MKEGVCVDDDGRLMKMFLEKGNEVRKKKFDVKGEKEEDVDDDALCGVRGGSKSNEGEREN